MKKKDRRTILKIFGTALLASICSLCAAFFVGCNQENPSVSGSEAEYVTVSIDKKTLTLPEWESSVLTAETTGTEEEILWSSENPAVATVDGGKVRALSCGETTITASAGQAKDSCKVVVIPSEVEPTLVVEEIDEKDKTLMIRDGGSFALNASVLWNTEKIEGATLSWMSDDESVATVENNGYSANVFGLREGETLIRILANVRGKTAVYAFTVRVNVESALLKTDDVAYIPYEGGYKVKINAAEEKTGDGTNVTVPKIYAFYKGEKIENPSVNWTTEDDDIVSLDPSTGKITAKRAGNAVVSGVWHYEETNKDYAIRINVEVERIDVLLDGVKEIVINRPESAVRLSLSDERVESFSVDDKTYTNGFTVSGTIVTLDNEKFDVADQRNVLQVKVVTNKRAYSFSANSYYAVADLDEWKGLWNASTAAQVFGKASVVKIENDIDATAYAHNGNLNYATMSPFSGIFDGQGHTITGATAGWAGLFNSLAEDGVVCNVAFVGIKLLKEAKIFFNIMEGRVENCYFEGYSSRTDTSATPSFCYFLGRNAVIRNVVLNIRGRKDTAGNETQKAIFKDLSAGDGLPSVSGFYAVVDFSDGTASNVASVNGDIHLYSSMAGMRSAVTMLPAGFFSDSWQIYDGILSFPSSQKEIRTYLDENGLTVEPISSVRKETETALTANTACEWKIEGLDSSAYSLENGVLLLNESAREGDTFTIVGTYTEERYGYTYEVRLEDVLIKKKPLEVRTLAENPVVGLNRPTETYSFTLDSEKEILSVSFNDSEIGKNEYTVSKKIVTINASAFTKAGTVEIAIETESVVYKATAEVVDMAIGTLDEFKAFWCKSYLTGTVTASVALTADIDASSYSFNGGTVIANYEFNGIFDGRGHTVSGVHSGYYGLFYNFGANAVLRNVAFTGIRFYRVSAIVNYKLEGRMENCYFEGGGGTAADNNALAKQIGANATLRNVLVYLHDRPAGTETQNGVFVSTVNSVTVTNAPSGVYVINTSSNGNICNDGSVDLIDTSGIRLYSSSADFKAAFTEKPEDIAQEYWDMLFGLNS